MFEGGLKTEEGRLKSEGKSFDNSAILVDSRRKGNSKKIVTCRNCGHLGHMKKDCNSKKASVVKGSKKRDLAFASLEYNDYSDVL